MVVADKPSMEVENNLAGPPVAIRFRETVRHGKSGAFYCHPTEPIGSLLPEHLADRRWETLQLPVPILHSEKGWA
jgi:hypothetical protein